MVDAWLMNFLQVYVTILYKLMHTFSEIPLPNEQARLDILKIHAAPITKHGEIDYEGVVKLAEDFNGADLRNVCTEAGTAINFFIIGFSAGMMYIMNGIPYSGKLSREKTFTNFTIFLLSAKVFSTKF